MTVLLVSTIEIKKYKNKSAASYLSFRCGEPQNIVNEILEGIYQTFWCHVAYTCRHCLVSPVRKKKGWEVGEILYRHAWYFYTISYPRVQLLISVILLDLGAKWGPGSVEKVPGHAGRILFHVIVTIIIRILNTYCLWQ